MNINQRSPVSIHMQCSLDGFIADSTRSLDWITPCENFGDIPPSGDFEEFDDVMQSAGCFLLGRNAFGAVLGQSLWWAYAKTPVLVAAHHPVESELQNVRQLSGDVWQLVSEAQAVAAGKPVRIVGGELARDAIAHGLVDKIVITYFPILLGDGVRLFETLPESQALQFTQIASSGEGYIQVAAKFKNRGFA